MSDRWHALITEVEPAPAKAGPLHGKRLLVKDLIDTAGIRTTYGSRIYADHVPARTAPAVRRLVDAGAVLPSSIATRTAPTLWPRSSVARRSPPAVT